MTEEKQCEEKDIQKAEDIFNALMNNTDGGHIYMALDQLPTDNLKFMREVIIEILENRIDKNSISLQ